MADVITRFKVETAEYDRKIGQSKKKLDEFSKGGQTAGNALKDFTSKMGLSVGSLTAMTGAVAAATAAIKVGTDAFRSSESNIDEWGRTVEGAKGAYDTFLQTLTNGNWSNFFSNLNEAIRGSRDLYDALDRLGSIKANNQAAIALTQQDIQKLRLRQQNGEDVTAELQAATERLAKLQRQEVEAGIDAGTKQMVQTLKNAGISEAMAKAAAEEIAKGGQETFDKYAQMVKDLEAAGTSKGKAVSKLGGLINYYEEGSFNEANLNEEQRRMYQLAKAITERETTLQEGISTFAQAVQQGTASAREEFKNTKYGLNGGGNGGGNTKPENAAIEGTIRYYQEMISGLNKQVGDAVDADVRDQLNNTIRIAKEELNRLQTGGNTWSVSAQSAPTAPTGGSMLANAAANIDTSAVTKAAEEWDNYQKSILAAHQANQQAFQSIGAIGQALQSIEDPAAKVMGIVAEAIANVAAAAAQAMAAKDTTASGWAWIGAAAAITGTMVTTIAAIKQATAGTYANGGMIPGNHYSGDQQLAAVNAGELILNRAQQSNLASQLSGQNNGRREVEFRISGQELVGILRQESNIKSYR